MDFERYQIVDENFGGPLVRVRSLEDGEEMWCRRSRLQNMGGAFALVSQERAKNLRVAFARAEERARKKAVADANLELLECK